LIIKPRLYRDYPWYVRFLFWIQKQKYGAALYSSQLWARSPRVFIGLSVLYGAFDRARSPLSPILRSLVILRVSQLNVCAFCIDLNASLLIKKGIDNSKLQDLNNWRKSSAFDEAEKSALEYAEIITLRNESPDDQLKNRLTKNFTDDEMVELTAIIAFQNMSTKFNTALDIPSQGFMNS
jgi:AhpD family alkylhydroperoxidase